MHVFFEWFRDFIEQSFASLNNIRITIGIYEVGYGWIFVAFIILGIIVAVLWKGSRK